MYQQMTERLISDAVDDISKRGELNVRQIPAAVRSVLNSLACHGKGFFRFVSPRCCTYQKLLHTLTKTGAVKFGDSLSMNQCVQITRGLAQCEVPFECAHGRPVMTPLMELTDLDRFDRGHEIVRKKPNYGRLFAEF